MVIFYFVKCQRCFVQLFTLLKLQCNTYHFPALPCQPLENPVHPSSFTRINPILQALDVFSVFSIILLMKVSQMYQ